MIKIVFMAFYIAVISNGKVRGQDDAFSGTVYFLKFRQFKKWNF